jgi:ABC-type transport system involved in multi-copper enzyme maturation permease subunit
MSAELLKLRALPFPRWTGAAVAAVVVVMGTVMLIIKPSDPDLYIAIPDASVKFATEIAAIFFGVWMATLEFSSGTLQRTLIAEPTRRRVLATKLAIALAVTAAAGVAVAAAAGGLSHLAANHAGVTIDKGELAGELFGSVPVWVAGSAVGFGFGLIARSLGGGIAISLVFILAFDGIISFIPGASDYTFGQLSQDLTDRISGSGDPKNGLVAALAGTIAWAALIIAPGWIRFLRGDLK